MFARCSGLRENAESAISMSRVGTMNLSERWRGFARSRVEEEVDAENVPLWQSKREWNSCTVERI